MNMLPFHERLKLLRYALGVSMEEMAGLIGLAPAKGADHLREMERGARPVSGPLQRVIRYMEQAVDVDEDAAMAEAAFKILPRWLDCSDLEDYEGSGGVEIIMHTRWPRFFGICVDDLCEPEALSSSADLPVIKMPEEGGLGWMVVLFIDAPSETPMRLIQEAVVLKTAQARRDLES